VKHQLAFNRLYSIVSQRIESFITTIILCEINWLRIMVVVVVNGVQHVGFNTREKDNKLEPED
jgi:hypothetical protein